MTDPDGRPVLVLNGPNLGRLGSRQPEIYGSTSHAELAALCVRAGSELGLAVQVRQSEAEADLLGWLHQAADDRTPVVINAGALTHTSIALRDAAAARTAPLVEVHISNVHAREEFRHHSYLSAVASGVIVGLGVEGYVLALSWISSTIGAGSESGTEGTGSAESPDSTESADRRR
jgi:3-dehydroquinate dehydratase-2